MTESVFETVEKSCQILKLDFSSAELAILAQEQEMTPEQLQAIGMVMDHLRRKGGYHHSNSAKNEPSASERSKNL